MGNTRRSSINGLGTNVFDGFLPLILSGMLWTVLVSVASLLVGLLLGLAMAAAELSTHKPVRMAMLCLTSILRGLPEIVVLFCCYFGGSIILTHFFGHFVGVNEFLAGVFSLSIIFAAYSAQVFKGAMHQIPGGQFESADAMGMSKQQRFWWIILPQAWLHAKPGLSNLWLTLLKDSSLVSLIGLNEMMSRINLAASETHAPFLFYSLAALLYLSLTSLSTIVSKRKMKWIHSAA